jgi:hypothetical protein
MLSNPIVKDSNSYLILKHAAQEGLEHVRLLHEQKKYIGTYFNFPKFRWLESGLPSITQNLFDGPIDYKGAFTNEFIQSAKSWKLFVDLVGTSSSLKRYFQIEDS